MQISDKFQNYGLACLQLMRPANIVTAWADILAGFAVSDAIITDSTSLAWLLLATTGLYGGGVVFNDVCDAQLDAIERPERPIPGGRISLQAATVLGILLLGVGILAAAQVSRLSMILAVSIAVLALIYDRYSKHHPLLGPLNMGLCRGGNLLLGVSAVPLMISQFWYLALIPILYIAAVTAISRGEVAGGEQKTGAIALVLFSIVLISLLALSWKPYYSFLFALPFWALFAVRVFPVWLKATTHPRPEIIRQAVKVGVISLILLDATLGAGFTGGLFGFLILGLLPFSLALARLFSVT
ncbi:polyprenyltransferase [Aphanothece hegewaldii CCALA 016]|uniref:Polyprenyltransferase n=1 Tax=Aphanothece hegewaldii CCALA 016 TaxID=2107694 RepID=A0A2T1M1C5_9CHRO|nr:UbiA-like protein EboC [Aphanothece hegewaldii]PSF38498.1 polyprenyltransferase [Aphanothece hegewaldii CCALA 016]